MLVCHRGARLQRDVSPRIGDNRVTWDRFFAGIRRRLAGEIEPWSWYIRKWWRRFESSARDPRPGVNGENMRKARSRPEAEEMLPEYDFSGGVRGKYADRFAKDTIMVVLDPDVAEVFPDPNSVNKALRALGQIIRDRPRRIGGRRSAR